VAATPHEIGESSLKADSAQVERLLLVSLMPGDWERRLDYLYGYYAIPLAEEAPTS